MTTSEDQMPEATEENIERLKENMEKVEQLSKRLIEVMAVKKPHTAALDGPNQELFARAATAYWTDAWQNPAKLLEQQLEYWGKSVLNFAEAQQAMTTGEVGEEEPAPRDKRFSNPLWETNPYFRLIRQQYQTNSDAIAQAVASVEDLDAKDKRRLRYFSQQIVDMMSPTNFLATNPDALQKAVETEGQSLIRGLENLVSDLEANDGELVVKLADESAFQVGGNLATSPGDVVYRNRMIEIIQYKAATETVHETPIVLFPPWINKFYILDLKAQNSMIKWLTEQGFSLFVVSWVNPDESYAETGLEDYVQDGFLAAVEEVKKICKVKQVNAVGYCIAGTTLSLTLSLMKQRGDKSIKSATFFTTLTDFSDQGEFTPFLQNDFIDGIEDEVNKEGLLRSWIISRTMSFLRSRDLVYGPAVRSYMMGETPPAFDLLFWNGDGTNLPGKMAIQYLRGLCQRNEFAEGGFELMGHKLRLSEVDVPVMAITCETDHIAAWKDCYRGVQKMGSRNKTFVVSESGHIAGIVNPPSKKKYGHYTNPDLKPDADTWLKEADFHEGSWWPLWEAWLKKRSGKQVPAREAGDSDRPSLAPAPGTYVVANPND
ncbi:PHA/PHB synthase family protein [Ruegeria sp.]|uniref:PHA/PHB synthase family protein n=1 Tax=Ruegeria sp. TaxID=1879320 RepID=UPI003B5BE075